MSDGGVLIAGIGNIFRGDDGFGVEVVRRLGEVPLPPEVRVADYGIRGVHLAYDLLDGDVDALILVDALPLGDAPGTIAVVEVDLKDPQWTLGSARATPDAHGMDPETVLRLIATLGGQPDRVLVVGCQPETLAEGMQLSDPVRAAVEPARDLVARLARETAGGDAGSGREEASREEASREEAGHEEVRADA